MNTQTTLQLRHWVTSWLLAALASAALSDALAAPCAGFTDVQDSHGFCPNIAWLKNRAVTFGCTETTYCPDGSVNRLQMAAFMNRLGNALTPVQLPIDAAPGAVDLDLGVVICQTQDFPVAVYPRSAYADLSFNAKAVADVGFAVDLVMSSNGGASWTNLNTIPNRGFVQANRWGGLADYGAADLTVGQTVRWGVRLTRGGITGAADLSDTRCQLRVLIHSRDGAASPF